MRKGLDPWQLLVVALTCLIRSRRCQRSYKTISFKETKYLDKLTGNRFYCKYNAMILPNNACENCPLALECVIQDAAIRSKEARLDESVEVLDTMRRNFDESNVLGAMAILTGEISSEQAEALESREEEIWQRYFGDGRQGTYQEWFADTEVEYGELDHAKTTLGSVADELSAENAHCNGPEIGILRGIISNFINPLRLHYKPDDCGNAEAVKAYKIYKKIPFVKKINA